MAYLRCVRQSRGQALVEAALIAPLIVLFLFTVVWFARVVLTWQQISTAARYGTDLIAYTPFNVTYIENDIKDYLCSAKTIGRVLDSEKLGIKIEINDYKSIKYDVDFKDISTISSLNPVSVINTFKGLMPGLNKKSFVEITYMYKMPKILRIIGKKNIEIKSRSEVFSGTGSCRAAERQK